MCNASKYSRTLVLLAVVAAVPSALLSCKGEDEPSNGEQPSAGAGGTASDTGGGYGIGGESGGTRATGGNKAVGGVGTGGQATGGTAVSPSGGTRAAGGSNAASSAGIGGSTAGGIGSHSGGAGTIGGSAAAGGSGGVGTAGQSSTGGSLSLSLPRIPWEGGPEYWKQFPKAAAAGWGDPNFFPIGVWWSSISTKADVLADKDIGLNFYVQLNDQTDFKLIKDNGMFWVGDKMNKTFDASSPSWVGYFLDDEVDGRYDPPSTGFAYLQSLVDALPQDGRFRYTNYTAMVIGWLNDADAIRYVNNYTDVVSLDFYWYSIPLCDWEPVQWELYGAKAGHCRVAQSYGATIDMLRQRDAVDGKLQVLFSFVENGHPSDQSADPTIKPGQMKGAVMSSVMHEARGIMWFNQSMGGPCISGNVFKTPQCYAENIAAAKEVNLQLKALAPVLNTQSYVYSCGKDVDTMLKTHGNSAYLFAMNGRYADLGPKQLTLPPELAGVTRADVLFEDRSVTITDGKLTDDFPYDHSYHVYVITP